jgi:hypothetical protein
MQKLQKHEVRARRGDMRPGDHVFRGAGARDALIFVAQANVSRSRGASRHSAGSAPVLSA